MQLPGWLIGLGLGDQIALRPLRVRVVLAKKLSNRVCFGASFGRTDISSFSIDLRCFGEGFCDNETLKRPIPKTSQIPKQSL